MSYRPIDFSSVSVVFLIFFGIGFLHADEPENSPLGNIFENVRFVDLSYPLNDTNQYWPGENYSGFEMKTIATLEKDGVLSKTLSFPEHLGTHIDAPNHFEPNQPSVADLTPEQLFGPGVVIDITSKAETDPDTMLTVEDIKAWEKEHGRIPEGAIVLLNTGWARFWKNTVRYQNRDARGQLHFPSYSAEAAKFLIEQRKIRGVGVDNLSIDRGISKDFEVHHIVNAAEKFGLENVAHLDQLPTRGFQVMVAPIKVQNGTGGPARVWALLPKEAD